MATTARIAATTSPASYTASVLSGTVANFAASSLAPGEVIKILKMTSSGSYEPINYVDAGGNNRSAELTQSKNVETVSGPIDIKIEKYATANSVEVVEYT